MLNVIPSTITGILNEPWVAKFVPTGATIVIVFPLLVIVKPFTVGMVPYVGVTTVLPL